MGNAAPLLEDLKAQPSYSAPSRPPQFPPASQPSPCAPPTPSAWSWLQRRGGEGCGWRSDEWAFYLIKLGVNWSFSIIFGPDWIFNTKCSVCVSVCVCARTCMNWAFLVHVGRKLDCTEKHLI